MTDFLKKKTIPYFIVAPPYSSKSAGVVTLYRLCHYLNGSGQLAYIAPLQYPIRTSPHLDAPIVDQTIFDFFMHEGIDPIFVYPDIIRGNPFGAKRVAWFLLHYPGAYGGQPSFDEKECVWSFSPHIASKTPKPGNVMSVPNIDLDLFKLPADGTERKGSCYYANKYLSVGHKLITVDGMPDHMTKLEGNHAEIAKILQRSKICYVYENTSVISEAVLCGCRVVLVRSDYFNEIHSLETQTGHAGVRWHDEGYTEDVGVAQSNYDKMCRRFFSEQCPRFIMETQNET